MKMRDLIAAAHGIAKSERGTMRSPEDVYEDIHGPQSWDWDHDALDEFCKQTRAVDLIDESRGDNGWYVRAVFWRDEFFCMIHANVTDGDYYYQYASEDGLRAFCAEVAKCVLPESSSPYDGHLWVDMDEDWGDGIETFSVIEHPSLGPLLVDGKLVPRSEAPKNLTDLTPECWEQLRAGELTDLSQLQYKHKVVVPWLEGKLLDAVNGQS